MQYIALDIARQSSDLKLSLLGTCYDLTNSKLDFFSRLVYGPRHDGTGYTIVAMT